jgi:hypothetical protein
MNTANAGQVVLPANGARPAGIYNVSNSDNYVMVLRFQKNILP